MADDAPTVIRLSTGTDGDDDRFDKGVERVSDVLPTFGVGRDVSKAFSYSEYGLAEKLSDEGFSSLSEGDLALVDTAFEGGKVGEVQSIDSSWTGTMSATIDTGASKFKITPYDDEYTSEYVATLDSKAVGEVSDEILHSMEKTTVEDVNVGSHVMLDVPNVGPVRGAVKQKRHTEGQGVRVDVDTGPVTFKVYDDPAGAVEKEMAYLVGKIPV